MPCGASILAGLSLTMKEAAPLNLGLAFSESQGFSGPSAVSGAVCKIVVIWRLPDGGPIDELAAAVRHARARRRRLTTSEPTPHVRKSD
jgi:hypothetical protein